MMKKAYILFLMFIYSVALPQDCKEQIVSDSIVRPSDNKKILANVLYMGLKNGGAVQFASDNGKYYLKITPHEKFGYIEDGALELKSGSKSFFVKNAKLHNIKDLGAFFVVEIYLNYVATLKEDGLTGIVFNKFEVKLEKVDTKNVERTAECFYKLNNKK